MRIRTLQAALCVRKEFQSVSTSRGSVNLSLSPVLIYHSLVSCSLEHGSDPVPSVYSLHTQHNYAPPLKYLSASLHISNVVFCLCSSPRVKRYFF